MNKEEKEQLEFEVEKVIGLEIEESDSSVGIFGNFFSLGFEVEKNKIWIGFDDDKFIDLLNLMKPHILGMINKQKIDREFLESLKGEK